MKNSIFSYWGIYYICLNFSTLLRSTFYLFNQFFYLIFCLTYYNLTGEQYGKQVLHAFSSWNILESDLCIWGLVFHALWPEFMLSSSNSAFVLLSGCWIHIKWLLLCS